MTARRPKWSWETLLEMIQERCTRDHETGCLIWNFGKDKDGYPKLFVDGKNWRGNRAVLFKLTGELGPAALHACDNPSCLEPSHLSWGTHSENVKDAYDKGRKTTNFKGMPGELNGRSKLSDADRDKIVELTLEGKNPKDLAREFGVAKSTIQALRRQRGVSWPPGRPK